MGRKGLGSEDWAPLFHPSFMIIKMVDIFAGCRPQCVSPVDRLRMGD